MWNAIYAVSTDKAIMTAKVQHSFFSGLDTYISQESGHVGRREKTFLLYSTHKMGRAAPGMSGWCPVLFLQLALLAAPTIEAHTRVSILIAVPNSTIYSSSLFPIIIILQLAI